MEIEKFKFICMYRYLTEKQRALVTALAELDEDLQGTVDGVSEDNKTKGKIPFRQKYKNNFTIIGEYTQQVTKTKFI